MRVFLTTVGTRGDVQPYVALGRGLQAAGHEVTLSTASRFEAFVKANGLDFAPTTDGLIDLLDTELDELRAYNTPVAEILNHRIRLGWTSTGHTAENVPTFATGPNAEFFDGTVDNTDIAGAIRERLNGD